MKQRKKRNRLAKTTLVSNEQNISIDLANLTDDQRIEYYNQYQSTFDAVKTWPNKTNKNWQPENLTGFLTKFPQTFRLALY